MENNLGKNLYKDLWRGKDICHQYNQIMPSNMAEKEGLLQTFLGKLGKNSCITQPFYCDFGYNIAIGDDFYGNHNLVILDGAKVTIGNHVFIAPNCCLSTATHPLDHEQRNAGIEYAEPITLEDNVWLGAGVNVLPGVTIGKNSVIGAGSVVTKDIPADVIAVGNPCRVLRNITEKDRFSPEEHEVLRFDNK